jgi:dipeptidyl aminopeptidase/acylaminoacyl peptidase
MKRLSLLVVAVVALSFSVSAQTAWTPETQVKVRAVGSPQISPDGRRVVYTINDAAMAPDKSEFVTQIWIATVDGKDNYQVTFGDKSSTNPKWSPDGTAIAFTSNRANNRNGLYLLRLSGGEAEPISDVKGSVGNFDWSPDGRSIAFMMSDFKTPEEEANDKGRNDFRWYEENHKLSRIYLTPVAKDASGKREAKKLADLARHISSFDFSPDGKRIAFTHAASPSVNDWPTSDVSLIDVSTGSVTALAAAPDRYEANPTFSPDGRWIALVTSDGPPRWAQSDRIALYPTAGGSPKVLNTTFDTGPNIAGWTPDGKKIYFTEPKGTVMGWYEFDVEGGTVKETMPARSVINALAMDKSAQVFAAVWQTADRPQELYVVRLTDSAPVQISRANDSHRQMPHGKTEVVKWKSKDGREIEGLLTYPVGYTAGTKVPLILNIHGGPAGVFLQSYIGGRGSYPIATFASKGYAILRPNPRGSSGYGAEFRRANIKDWGGMDYEDLMTGVDHVIGMGVADPNRLGVMGWSYGGYMTSTIITKTKRFKAASAGAPVTNLMSFNGTADIPSFVPDYFGGEYWENPEIYAKHSAMFNIKGVTTPTLVQHGEADVRVPIEQGYQLYTALKRQGVPTRMLILPRQPHGPNEPKMQIAAMQSNLDWFDKYLK